MLGLYAVVKTLYNRRFCDLIFENVTIEPILPIRYSK